MKYVSKETYDKLEESTKEAWTKYEKKAYVKTLSGQLKIKGYYKDLEIKNEAVFNYLEADDNLSDVYDDLFDSDGKVIDENVEFWIKEFDLQSKKSRKVFWTILAKANYNLKKRHLDDCTYEEKNSTVEETTIDDYEVANPEIKDLKSEKVKKED